MDKFTKEKRSQIMSKIKSKSGIEVLPQKFKGLYLRKHPKGIFGKPDFGNRTRKVALFIDGCFWHGCPKHYRKPKSNVAFWVLKIKRNKSRDRNVVRKLTKGGWEVIRVWECQLNNNRERK